MMAELKTLKEMQREPDGGNAIDADELRAEAIKWIKAIKFNEPKEFFNRKDISDDSQMIAKLTALQASNLFARFFNITEEELE